MTDQHTLSKFTAPDSKESPTNQTETSPDPTDPPDNSDNTATTLSEDTKKAARKVIQHSTDYPSDTFTTETRERDNGPGELHIRDPTAQSFADAQISNDDLPTDVPPDRAIFELKFLTSRTLHNYKATVTGSSHIVNNSSSHSMLGPHSQYGTALGTNQSELPIDIRPIVAKITRKVLSLLSHPYHESYRTIPATQIHVGIPPVVTDFLAVTNGTASHIPYSESTVREILNTVSQLPAQLPDETPTDQERAYPDSLTTARIHSQDTYKSPDSKLHRQEAELEETIAAKCGLTLGGFGSGSREAQLHATYAHYSLSELNEKLSKVRRRISKHERANTQLKTTLSHIRRRRRDQLRNQLPEQIQTILNPSES